MRIVFDYEDLIVKMHIHSLEDQIAHLRRLHDIVDSRLQLAQAELLNAYKPKPEQEWKEPHFQMPTVDAGSDWNAYVRDHMDAQDKADEAQPKESQ